MKSRYSEPFYVTRGENAFYMFGKVKESVVRNLSDENGINYLNVFEFEIWKNEVYQPNYGDLVYYNRPYVIGGDSSDALVIKSILENATNRTVIFSATKKDFVSSQRVIQAYSSNILRRTYDLVGVSNGHIVYHLETTPTLPEGLIVDFMATFYLNNGIKVDYVNYERIDNNSIRLIIQPETTFTGTVTIERR
jgi:hypothetical protein